MSDKEPCVHPWEYVYQDGEDNLNCTKCGQHLTNIKNLLGESKKTKIELNPSDMFSPLDGFGSIKMRT